LQTPDIKAFVLKSKNFFDKNSKKTHSGDKWCFFVPMCWDESKTLKKVKERLMEKMNKFFSFLKKTNPKPFWRIVI